MQAVNKNNITKEPALFILIVLISLASVGSVLPTPALPAIAQAYGVSSHLSEWVVTIFILGYAISQLIYGPISNSFGRKKALLIGVSISVFGGLLCIIASNFTLLMVGRLLMALGAGCGLSMTLTIINDYYDGPGARKKIAYATSAFAILPGLAIMAGGLLTDYYSWRMCFVLLTSFSLFALCLIPLLPETHSKSQRVPLNMTQIISQYVNVFKTKKMYLYALLWSTGTTIIYSISATAAIAVQQTFNVSPGIFANYFMIVIGFYFIGNLLTGKLSSHLSKDQSLLTGAFITTVGAAGLILCNELIPDNMLLFFIPLAVVYLGLPLIFATASAQVVQEAADKSTTASVASFINMSIAFIGSSLVSGIYKDLYFYIPIVVMVLVIMSNILVMLVVRREKIMALNHL